MSNFYSKNLAAVALFSFIAVAIFCVWTATTMAAESAMNDCTPYGNEAVFCSANAQNHISAWQNFLNVIPQKTFDLLLLALLLVFVSVTYKNIWPRAPEIMKSLVARAYATLDIINPINRALARGIIQPKIYPSYIG